MPKTENPPAIEAKPTPDVLPPPRSQRFGEPRERHETPEKARHTIEGAEAGNKQLTDCGHPIGGIGLGATHPNQSVEPSMYAQELTRWLSLPESERVKQPKPQPPKDKADGEKEAESRPDDPKEAAEAGSKAGGDKDKGKPAEDKGKPEGKPDDKGKAPEDKPKAKDEKPSA